MIGSALGKALLEKGWQVIIASRDRNKVSTVQGLTYTWWDTAKQEVDKTAFSKADYIVNLAGAGVAEKRWKAKRKEEILHSRVNSNRLIVKCLKEIPNGVKAVINASAVGWYGADPVVPNLASFKEDDSPANDFLGTTCQQWEATIKEVDELQKRLVILRIGIVLSKQGGAIKEFIKPMKWGVAAILGNGKQMISWIHIDDLVNMFIAALENNSMKGVYNAVAPEPVSNKNLVLSLAKSRGRLFIPVRVPSFLLKLLLGEMSIEVLKSATVSADKIKKTGFTFRHAVIGSAISSLAE